MTGDLYSKNLTRYVLYGCASVLVGVLTALAQQLPGADPINWRFVASGGVSALLSVLTMALASSTLTRLGSEGLAADVNDLRAQGYHRDELTVVPKAEAVTEPAPLTDQEIGRLADVILAKNAEGQHG